MSDRSGFATETNFPYLVGDVQRREAGSVTPNSPAGFSGTVAIARPDERVVAHGVSRLDGEDSWTIDSQFIGGLPSFVNGYGARYLATRKIDDPKIVSDLDALVREAVAA